MTTSTTVTVGKKPSSALWADFIACAKTEAQHLSAEDGWRTTLDLAEEVGVARITMEKRLATEVREGRMERILGRSRHNNQRTYYYRPLPQQKRKAKAR